MLESIFELLVSVYVALKLWDRWKAYREDKQWHKSFGVGAGITTPERPHGVMTQVEYEHKGGIRQLWEEIHPQDRGAPPEQ